MKIIELIFLGLLLIPIYYLSALTWGAILFRQIMPFTCDLNNSKSIFLDCVTGGALLNVGIFISVFSYYSKVGNYI
jgi:hypothetical protein